MSATTARAIRPGGDPGTPVIIKSGGGVDDTPQLGVNLPEPSTPVEIDSPITFVELMRERTKWESSQTTTPGRLMGITITDGGVLISCDVPDPSRDLSSITIKYGSAQLIARESRGDHGKVFLVIESPEVPFSGPDSGEWTSSAATFPHLMQSVTMMVGEQRQLHHECHNALVEVAINFQQQI